MNALVRRQAETAPPEPDLDAQTDPELDAELHALLDELEATFPTAPAVPAFEAIASTTAAEFSRGELEQEIMRLWRRERVTFTSAARRIAQQNTRGDRGPRATQSAALVPTRDYEIRWSVNLFAADYDEWSDLPDVARLMREGSPFQEALAADFDNVIPLEDPTGDAIETGIFNGIMGLWTALDPGEIGQLVVTFSGHGGAGAIAGVDGRSLNVKDLQRLAELGADFNVHVVYILDTCRAGPLAMVAQAAAVEDLRSSAEGLETDDVFTARLERLTRFGRARVEVARRAYALGDLLREHRRGRTDETFLAIFDELSTLGDDLPELRDSVGGTEHLDPLPEADAIAEHVESAQLGVIVAMAGRPRAVMDLLRTLAQLLDLCGDATNAEVIRITEALERARTPTSGSERR